MNLSKFLVWGLLFLCPLYSFPDTIKVPLHYSTIQEAINNAKNGDTILVSDGIYYEEVNFNGYAAHSVIIKSVFGPDNCIIDCQKGSYSAGFVFNSQDCKSTIEGFTIKNATMGIWAYAGSSPTIKNNIIENCEMGINCGSEAKPIIISNHIRNCGGLGEGGGISISWSPAIVHNNLITNNSSSKGGGIYCYYCSPSIINNTIVENSNNDAEGLGAGMYIKNSSPEIINNILAFSDGIGVVVIGNTSLPDILYNDFYGNSGGNIYAGDTDETIAETILNATNGNISENPMFFETGYSLTTGSPCVDAGTPDTTDLGIGETDFFGLSRIYDGDNNGTAVIDMGAIELQVGPGDNTEYVSICQGEEYEGHSESGVFQRTLTSSTGSDSIVTTYLTVHPTYNIEEDVTICEGEDYFGFSIAGTHIREFKSVYNCDSIITTHLSIRPIGNCYLTLKVPSDFPTIQSAMDAANSGDTVIVADGTYTGEGNLYLKFNGKAIVVKSENGPENCIIDCVDGTGVQAFLITDGETRGSVVNGFKIINGCWVIYVENSSPTITGNILIDNNSGVYCGLNSNPLVENNTISYSNENGIYCYRSKGIIQNNTIRSTGETNISGIYCQVANPTIQDNILSYNYYGIKCGSDSDPLIERNTITQSYKYGIYCSGSSPEILKNEIINNKGTGIYCYNSSPVISRNLIKNCGGSRFADTGRGTYDNHNRPYEIFVGGIDNGGISINNHSNPNIQNNIITGNKGLSVGAVFCDETSAPIIVNNHIINNSSIYGGSVSLKNASAKIINNIVAGSKSSDTYQGVSRWYKDDLLARSHYDGVVLDYVTYFFGFINYGPPGNIEISGCQGFHQTVWAETGERFWVEAASGVFYGDYGGLYVTVSSDINSFAIDIKREYNFVQHGCKVIYSPEITSYGTNDIEGLVRAGIIIPNKDNVPEIAYNNVYDNSGGNYIFSDSVETKSAQVFDLTGTNGNISSDPLLNNETYELKEGSPCIDAGLADLTGYDVGSVDYFGNTRITDGNGDGNTIIDIGAYESESSTIQTEEYISICQGEEYEGHTDSETFQRTLTAATGADSIVTTYLTVNPNYELEEYKSICEGDNYLGLTEEGNHFREFETISGCDSTVITHLTVNPTYESEEYISICEGDNYLGLTEEGDHQRAFESVHGCDSIVVTHLAFYPPFKPTFEIDQDTLTSLQVYSVYQWFDENGIIEGATDQKYIIGKSGDYYLKAQNENGCVYNSDTIFVRYSSSWEIGKDGFTYSVMPNPNNGNFLFRIDQKPPEKITLKLFNTLGQVIETRQLDYPEINQTEQFNVSHLSKGIYQLIIYTDSYKDNRKIVVD